MTAIEEKHQFIAESKMLKVLSIMRLLCTGHHSLEELAERFDTTKRTISRYITLLEFMDIPTDKDFEGKYFIVQGHCPLCGVTTNNHHE
jgi:predicted DNA-binding transcriptional regulator YafY